MGQVPGDSGQEGRHDRRVLCFGKPKGGVKRALGDGLPGEGKQDAPD